METGFGVVIVTHGDLGESLLATCRMITGERPGITSVAVRAGDGVDQIRDRIAGAIGEVRGNKGVILLVDMFGGTPSNIGLSFLGEEGVEVVTGVNLPMLTKIRGLPPDLSLRETAATLRDYGREHIKVATEYLAGD